MPWQARMGPPQHPRGPGQCTLLTPASLRRQEAVQRLGGDLAHRLGLHRRVGRHDLLQLLACIQGNGDGMGEACTHNTRCGGGERERRGLQRCMGSNWRAGTKPSGPAQPWHPRTRDQLLADECLSACRQRAAVRLQVSQVGVVGLKQHLVHRRAQPARGGGQVR